MKYIFYILLLLSFFEVFAKEYADKDFYLIDSLVVENLSESDKKLLKEALNSFHSTDEDTIKLNTLSFISENLSNECWIRYNDLLQSFAENRIARPKSKKLKKIYKRHLATALNNFGYWHMNRGDITIALTFYEKALILNQGKENRKALASLYSNIALCHKKVGAIQVALNFNHKALVLQEQIKDEKGLSYTYNNLGLVYKKQGELEVALKYYKKSLAIKEKLGLHSSASTLINIGMIYDAKKDFDKSLEYFYRALKHDSLRGNKSGIGLSLNNIAQTYEMQGKIEEAYQLNLQALKAREEANDKRGVAYSLNNISRTKYDRGLIKEALNDSKRALKISLEIGFPDNISASALVLSDLYGSLNQGMKALEMYKLYVQMKDSINNEETHKASIRQQTQYEFEKAQIVKENEAKEEARLEAAATLRRNSLQYSLIFLGILLLFGIVLSLGFIKVSPNIAEGLIFFAFLILFEFILVFTEPYLEDYTNGEPMYNLLANAVIALLIFPLHDKLETVLKKRIVK